MDYPKFLRLRLGKKKKSQTLYLQNDFRIHFPTFYIQNRSSHEHKLGSKIVGQDSEHVIKSNLINLTNFVIIFVEFLIFVQRRLEEVKAYV